MVDSAKTWLVGGENSAMMGGMATPASVDHPRPTALDAPTMAHALLATAAARMGQLALRSSDGALELTYREAEQVGYVMGDAGNRIAVCGDGYADVVRAAAAHGTRVEHLLDLDAGGLDELVAAGDAGFDLDDAVALIAPEDLITLIYTSGTTGPPKGVELTHAKLKRTPISAKHAAAIEALYA